MTEKGNRAGLLIAFEGIDGTGKSTQLQMLAQFLRERGCPVVTTREPTDGEYGQRIRRLYTDRAGCSLEEELELFIRDRRQHVDTLIKPQLAAGSIVLTDRYYYSTAAYQGAAGMDVAEIFERNSFAPVPDRVILLTMDPELSVDRIEQGRGETCNDFEQLDQLKKVAALFASFDDPCIRRVDASPDPASVHGLVRKEISVLLEESNFPCP
jgi:dTMP kinase